MTAASSQACTESLSRPADELTGPAHDPAPEPGGDPSAWAGPLPAGGVRRGRQLAFFAAGSAPTAVSDLDGLLCGAAHLVRRREPEPGTRLSLLVTERWRVQPLLRELAGLGLGPQAMTGDAADGVRTAFRPELDALAERWVQGSVVRAPKDLVLGGAALRWWLMAGGRFDAAAGHVLLRLAPGREQDWAAVGAALAAAGLPGALVGPRADGPAYRLVGSRRLLRLRELVGDRPEGLPDDAWPTW